jgi:hypothetical protein
MKSAVWMLPRESADSRKGIAVTRALRNHNVWLALTYVGLLLLMAHAQV